MAAPVRGSASQTGKKAQPATEIAAPRRDAQKWVALGLCAVYVAVSLATSQPTGGNFLGGKHRGSSPPPSETARQLQEAAPVTPDPSLCGKGFNDGGDCKNCLYGLADECQGIFSCPAGYYCPAGVQQADSLELANERFATTWWPQGGPGRVYCEAFPANPQFPGWWAYKCECWLGFWCPADIALPKFCPSRYECTRPFRRARCPEGRYCQEGTVKGFPCENVDCPKGTLTPDGGGFWLIWFILISLFAYVVFWFMDKYRTNKMSRQNLELEDYYDVLQEQDATQKAKREEAKKKRASTTSLPTVEGYRIEFEDLRLKLPTGVTIMRGPSGALEPGKSTAIMGASGAGKTTIMNLITGKVKKTGGRITCNGEEVEDLSKFRSRTAFVPQEDVMHRELTVLDNITFSGQTRLPADWTQEMKREKIMQVLYTLDLTHIQHTIVGDEFERGISGGQRKRVNVGLELVADPKLLFLDEPTSGLDSVSATKLSKILRQTAEDHNLTIAAVIHSPGPEAFMAFHNFILLQTGGRLVYYGPTPEVEGYFEDIGFRYPRGETLAPLADHILCCVAGDPPKPSEDAKYKLSEKEDWDHMTGFTKLWHIKKGLPPYEEDEAPDVVLSTQDKIKFRVAEIFTGIKSTPSKYRMLFCPPTGEGEDERKTIGFLPTFILCFRRACHQNFTSFKSFFLGVILLYLIIGFFLGSLYNSGDQPPNVLGGYPPDICHDQYPALKDTCLDMQQNGYVASMAGVIFIFVALGAATSAATFGCETAQYWREASTGLNSPAYFFAKAIADIPTAFISTLALWAPFVSIFVTPMPKGEFLFALYLITTFGWASGYFISFFVPYRYCGLSAVAWSVFWSLLWSGQTIRIHDMPQAKFLFYSSAPRWFMEGFFYASTVIPYKKVRYGPSKGEIYLKPGITRMQQNLAYWQTYWQSMGWLFLVICCLTLINCFVITTTRLDKKV